MEERKGEIQMGEARQVQVTRRHLVALACVCPGLIVSNASEETAALAAWGRSVTTASSSRIALVCGAEVIGSTAKPLKTKSKLVNLELTARDVSWNS